MRAQVGDRITVPGPHVGQAARTGEVVEVRNAEGEPPFVVRWEDGHQGLCYPPPESRVQPAGAHQH